jgi:hypothetical protein
MNGATRAANDAKVKANLDTIKKATVMLGVSSKGVYPVETGGCTIGSCTNLDPVIKEYLPNTIPGTYTYQSDGTAFTLSSALSTGYAYQFDSGTNTYSTNSPINGSCGTSNNQNLSSIPVTNLCTLGTATVVAGTGPWTWSCTGIHGGTTASCQTGNIPVDGVCGSKNGKYASATPTGTEACTIGTITGMTGSYSWTCSGTDSGNNPTCATVAATYAVQSFTSSATWTVPASVTSVEYLVVAAGGGGGSGGGSSTGGGGGGGGFKTGIGLSVTGSANVVVGVGVAGAVGGNSIFSSITSIGGGVGGNAGAVGGGGGSGGGGGGSSSGTSIGGVGTVGQGHDGKGNAGFVSYPDNPAGGGGGAGGDGLAASSNTQAGNGGSGISSSITGTPTCYAGGGGGGVLDGAGTPGTASCGGAPGKSQWEGTAGSGALNTGGGGGGSSGYGSATAGGSGIVIIKYINNY